MYHRADHFRSKKPSAICMASAGLYRAPPIKIANILSSSLALEKCCFDWFCVFIRSSFLFCSSKKPPVNKDKRRSIQYLSISCRKNIDSYLRIPTQESWPHSAFPISQWPLLGTPLLRQQDCVRIALNFHKCNCIFIFYWTNGSTVASISTLHTIIYSLKNQCK